MKTSHTILDRQMHTDTHTNTNTPTDTHSLTITRVGIKIFKVLARLASNSKILLAKSEKNSPKSCIC
jgi:hypothetical protein